MKVVSYYKSVPEINNNMQKVELLQNFVAGVKRCGDEGIYHTGHGIVDCDVAVIQGWVYADLSTRHLKLRSSIIETQKQKQKYTLTADANLFLYNDQRNPHGYLRYIFNGIFPSTGI